MNIKPLTLVASKFAVLEVKEATEGINHYMSISQNGLYILKSVGLVRKPTIEVSLSCSSEIISVTSFQVFHSIVEYNSFCIDAIDTRLTTMYPLLAMSSALVWLITLII